jgi:hypothetical protein
MMRIGMMRIGIGSSHFRIKEERIHRATHRARERERISKKRRKDSRSDTASGPGKIGEKCDIYIREAARVH